jgi:NitT/TauT family transport system ATP-binding protein
MEPRDLATKLIDELAQPETKTPRIELVGISKQFTRPGAAPFLALTDINAVVEDKADIGEMICIVGPSGCGKSTLLSLLAGFDTHIPQTSGTMKFNGIAIKAPSPERGMLFQDYGCFPHLSVLQNIGFGLTLHQSELRMSTADITSLAMTWLGKVHLTEKDAHKYPHELSGGMRQRVALARCLALEPDCMLMDEPFSALDEPTRYEMQRLLVELWEELQATVILVSHSIREAVYLGDRVWVMCGAPGTIVAEFADVPLPDLSFAPAIQQSQPEFAEHVKRVSDCFYRTIKAPREQLEPIHADGNGRHLCPVLEEKATS